MCYSSSFVSINNYKRYCLQIATDFFLIRSHAYRNNNRGSHGCEEEVG